MSNAKRGQWQLKDLLPRSYLHCQRVRDPIVARWHMTTGRATSHASLPFAAGRTSPDAMRAMATRSRGAPHKPSACQGLPDVFRHPPAPLLPLRTSTDAASMESCEHSRRGALGEKRRKPEEPLRRQPGSVSAAQGLGPLPPVVPAFDANPALRQEGMRCRRLASEPPRILPMRCNAPAGGGSQEVAPCPQAHS